MTPAQTGRDRLVLAAVAFLFFGGSLAVGFYLDDVHNLESALLAPLTPAGLGHGFTVFDARALDVWCVAREPVRFFRPLFLLVLKLEHLAFGGHAAGYHMVNLGLHVANVWLVHALLLRLRLPHRAALLGAALFAGFPHHTAAVIWISGGTEVLLATFVLAALVLHAGRRTGAAAVMVALALLTKESAVALPAYLALVEWALAPDDAPRRQVALAAARRLAPAAALTAVYLAYRFLLFPSTGAPPTPYYVGVGDPAFAPALAAKTVYYYFAWLTGFPVMPIAPVHYLLTHPAMLAGALAVVAIGLALVARALRATRAFPPLLAMTLACQVPVAMVMSSNHYLYLANAAVAAIAALVLLRSGRLRRPGRIALAVMALGAAAHAAFGVAVYRGLSARERRVAAALAAAAPEVVRSGGDLYLINLPFGAAHAAQRLRVLEGADHLSPHLLTVSAEPFDVGRPPSVAWQDDHTLVLDLPDGLLPGELGELFRMMGARPQAGRRYRAGPAIVTPEVDHHGRVHRMVVELRYGLGAGRTAIVLFRQIGRRVEVVRLAPAGEQAIELSW